MQCVQGHDAAAAAAAATDAARVTLSAEPKTHSQLAAALAFWARHWHLKRPKLKNRKLKNRKAKMCEAKNENKQETHKNGNRMRRSRRVGCVRM